MIATGASVATGLSRWARTRNADFGISIYNADGSEAEISGNGLRIFGLYAHSVCGVTGDHIRVETKAGISLVRLQLGRTGEVIAAAVDMGRASFRPSDLPCTLGVPELVEQPIEIEGRMLRFTGVSVGNPHCVIFGEEGKDWTRDDLLSLGPALECHPLFPNVSTFSWLRLGETGTSESGFGSAALEKPWLLDLPRVPQPAPRFGWDWPGARLR